MNPDATHDCARPRGPIWKVGWAGVKDKWPGAYEAAKAFNVSNEEMGQMIAAGDLEGRKLEEVVDGQHEDRWSGWNN